MKNLNQLFLLLAGVLIGTASSPWTFPFLSEFINKVNETQGYRVPELKINQGTSQVFIWKSVIPAEQQNNPGLSMHRHLYSRVLIPITDGVLQRRDADGKTTDYVLIPGKPLPLPADTADGFHTDNNIGKKDIEVMVVQFNQDAPVTYSPLTEPEIKASFGKGGPKQ